MVSYIALMPKGVVEVHDADAPMLIDNKIARLEIVMAQAELMYLEESEKRSEPGGIIPGMRSNKTTIRVTNLRSTLTRDQPPLYVLPAYDVTKHANGLRE